MLARLRKIFLNPIPWTRGNLLRRRGATVIAAPAISMVPLPDDGRGASHVSGGAIDDPGGERPLAFHAVPRAALEPAGFGLRAPAADSPAIALADIAVFLVPGLAFDRAGRRLGWGRGHYDATLARAPGALRVGLGFGCQVVDEVPHEAHDAALHVIITEDATLAVA